MPRAVGFRVEPTAVHYAVVEGTLESPVLLDDGRYAAPAAYDEAEALSWYRTRTRGLLEKHAPTLGAIKFMETVAGRGRMPRATDAFRRRHRIEGVLLQLLHETGIHTMSGPFATVSSGLGTRSAKAYLEREHLHGIDWSGKSNNVREAVLAATAALSGSQ